MSAAGAVVWAATAAPANSSAQETARAFWCNFASMGFLPEMRATEGHRGGALRRQPRACVVGLRFPTGAAPPADDATAELAPKRAGRQAPRLRAAGEQLNENIPR